MSGECKVQLCSGQTGGGVRELTADQRESGLFVELFRIHIAAVVRQPHLCLRSDIVVQPKAIDMIEIVPAIKEIQLLRSVIAGKRIAAGGQGFARLVFHAAGQDRGTVPEGTVNNNLDIGFQIIAERCFGTAAAGLEGAGLDCFQGIRECHIGQVRASFERTVVDYRDALRDYYFLQLRMVQEGIVVDQPDVGGNLGGFTRAGILHEALAFAMIKAIAIIRLTGMGVGVLFLLNQGFGCAAALYGKNGAAPLEHIHAAVRHIVRQFKDLFAFLTNTCIPESIRPDDFQPGREVDLRQLCTAGKCSIINQCQRLRQLHAGQIRVLIKRIPVNDSDGQTFDQFRNANFGNTAPELPDHDMIVADVIPHEGNAAGFADCQCLAAVSDDRHGHSAFKRVHGDVLKIGGQHNAYRTTLGKRPRTNLRHRWREKNRISLFDL